MIYHFIQTDQKTMVVYRRKAEAKLFTRSLLIDEAVFLVEPLSKGKGSRIEILAGERSKYTIQDLIIRADNYVNAIIRDYPYGATDDYENEAGV